MNDFPKVILKSGRDRSLKRFHLWVFSGAVKKIEGKPGDGDIVEVFSTGGEYLATGHFQNGSIVVRIFSFEPTNAGRDYWQNKFGKALQLRLKLGFGHNDQTNVFRFVHGEGDGLPGLIIDYYNGVAVLQAYSVGMWRHRKLFAKILMDMKDLPVQAVYDKSRNTLDVASNDGESEEFLAGTAEQAVVMENGYRFEVDFREGQKTGFFIDQRENRLLLRSYCQNMRVANIYSYTGGFSVYAAAGGASLIDSVDASEKAIALAEKHMQLNFGTQSGHRFFAMDVFDFFSGSTETYDIIVLDPPAFAKHRHNLNNALIAYRRINEAAMRKLSTGGVLFTFSCSQVVNKMDFRKVVFSAAASTGRSAAIIHQLSQPGDHPVNIYHPEGEYLKGLVVYVA